MTHDQEMLSQQTPLQRLPVAQSHQEREKEIMSASFAARALATVCLLIGLTGCPETPPVTNNAKPTISLVSPPGTESIVLGMGCFWGAEKRMSQLPGVLDVESGYANGDVGGDYESVLAHERALQFGQASGRNHAEVVKVTFDPKKVTLPQVLAQFWESHDPTQGDRQGNDVGSNYRSAIYTQSDAQLHTAEQTRAIYQQALTAAGKGQITTEIAPLTVYYTAETYHQDYLVKNPNGYCGLGGTGVKFPFISRTAQGARDGKDTTAEAFDVDGNPLSPTQCLVAFQSGTEQPFTSPLLKEHRAGTFVDLITGAALFRSDTKFDSGTGWPSFFQPLPGAITLHKDSSHRMQRVEVRSASSGIHLGHVFDDGPAPTGKRYCINGNVLKFVPDH